MIESIVYVQNAGNTLKYPVRRVFLGSQVSYKDHSDSHSIFPVLRHIYWRFQIVFELQFIGFRWNNLYDWHLIHQLLRWLFYQVILLYIPISTLQIDPLNIAAVLRFLFYAFGVSSLSYYSIQSWLIQSPSLYTARCLY